MQVKKSDTCGFQMTPVSYTNVDLTNGFWKQRQQLNRDVTLEAEYEQLVKTKRVESLSQTWTEDSPYRPHHYWDSDIAKWIEAASYVIAKFPNPEIEKKIDNLVSLMIAGQRKDGYFNTYFSTVEKGKRWTNIYVMHELYCAGHLIEAAVAYHEATGKDAFLSMMRRYVDHILTIFGSEDGKIQGYPGHEELELALVKLYRVTNHRPYLDLATFFINERGKKPHFFELEALQRGENPDKNPLREILNRNYLSEGPYASYQAHKEVRDQTDAVGHAVRAMYLYTAMADIAGETHDVSLLQACRNLWKSVTKKRMSITGGVGTLEFGERFTFDYDLPNETVYNETCASIGLIFWAHRMLQIEKDSTYADIMEQTLYNGVISGVSLTGDRFFYSNHLACHPQVYKNNIIRNPRLFPERQSWFEVSCCPPNLARLTANLGQYIYSTDDEGLFVHLYLNNTATISLFNETVGVEQKTNYPWDGEIAFSFNIERPLPFTLNLRIPDWCRNPSLQINGDDVVIEEQMIKRGYLAVNRTWNPEDKVTWMMPMEARYIQAHPSVRQDTGRVALKRGPVVYCFEETDNGKNLFDLMIDTNVTPAVQWNMSLLGGIMTLTLPGYSRDLSQWEDTLYQDISPAHEKRMLTAIPYYTWSNRDLGEMLVWIRAR
nr:beta-L-arabinofuranosidase domain-containing protein [uncultured Sphaerochaeta sp.]